MVSSPPPRVLIVEDNILIALDIEQLLREQGMEIAGLCPDVLCALEAIADEAVDVAVVDYLLIDETSDEVIDELASRNIPTAICSGTFREELARQFPGRPILTKPFAADELCAVVNRLASNGGKSGREQRAE